METNKKKNNQVTYFLIGLVGGIVFAGLLIFIFRVNSFVPPFIPQFILISITFLFGFACLDAALMAILLEDYCGKYKKRD